MSTKRYGSSLAIFGLMQDYLTFEKVYVLPTKVHRILLDLIPEERARPQRIKKGIGAFFTGGEQGPRVHRSSRKRTRPRGSCRFRDSSYRESLPASPTLYCHVRHAKGGEVADYCRWGTFCSLWVTPSKRFVAFLGDQGREKGLLKDSDQFLSSTKATAQW